MRKRTIFGKNLSSIIIALACMAPVQGYSATPDTAGSLTVSNEPIPMDVQNQLYTYPSQARPILPSEISGESYFSKTSDTVVGRKIDSLRNELISLQGLVSELSAKLTGLQVEGQRLAAEYYANMATIRTQLQSGTTPGNPRLVKRLTDSRQYLEALASNVAALNNLAVEISNAASMSSFLGDSARSIYSLSGAIEEDHILLAKVEDGLNRTMVSIDRLLNNINDDISRTTVYMNTERDNLRTMSLAISTGSMFGRSLANTHFKPTSYQPPAAPQPMMQPSQYQQPAQPQPPLPQAQPMARQPQQPARMDMASYGGPQGVPQANVTPDGPKPLVKVRFTQPNVNFEQPVYMAVSEAVSRYPDARFELLAVHPTSTNSAQQAIESTKAKRNAEKVLRSLTNMGLGLDRIDVKSEADPQARTSEVHLYVY